MQTEMSVFTVHTQALVCRDGGAVKAWQHRCTALAAAPLLHLSGIRAGRGSSTENKDTLAVATAPIEYKYKHPRPANLFCLHAGVTVSSSCNYNPCICCKTAEGHLPSNASTAHRYVVVSPSNFLPLLRERKEQGSCIAPLLKDAPSPPQLYRSVQRIQSKVFTSPHVPPLPSLNMWNAVSQ